MFSIKVDTSDLQAKIGQLDTQEMAQVIGVAVAESTRDLIASYPSPSRAKQPFKTAKQRMFFFAALRSGQIQVPYRRSGDLGRSWVTEPTTNGAELKNTRGYADLVHDAKAQAKYHRGVWKTDQDAADEMERSGEAQRIAEKVVENELQKAGLT